MGYTYDSVVTAASRFLSLLDKINKVRETISPPKQALSEQALNNVLKLITPLDKLLKSTFGSDYRLIVMANGVDLTADHR